MKNYSRQREAILNVLRSTNTHPTASWIYGEVKKQIPNISLGTVYRNLSALAKNGDILSISVGDGFEHFDGDINPHAHLTCKCCHSITDLVLPCDTISETAKNHGFITETAVYIAYGVCKDCNLNNKNLN